MKVQTALRMEESIIEAARREAERQNRSLANFVETALADILTGANSEVPVLSVIEGDDLDGAVALDDHGSVDLDETDRLFNLAAIAGRDRGG